MIKRLFICFIILFISSATAIAAKLPDGIQSVLKKAYPSVDIRFDGVIILPNGTIYLPLYPAKIKTPSPIQVAETYPAKTSLSQYPDVVIFNNDFVLLKVINNSDGTRTVKKFDKPPIVVKTGLLPQDMLVPKNLIIPENLKSILGTLCVRIAPEDEIRVKPTKLDYDKPMTFKNIMPTNTKSSIPQLKDKVLYISTNYTKDIQVVNGEAKQPTYALTQRAIPCSIAISPDYKFLLVTTYNSTLVYVISIADDRIIKQIDLTSNASEIVVDRKNNYAYVSAPSSSTIYQINLFDMTLKKKIRVNGYCEKLLLADKYLMYVDKYSNRVWSIEFDNDYVLRDLGAYPNISKLAYSDGLLYLISRTKNRVAAIDYKNQTLFTEFQAVEKPIDMISYGKSLFILGAKNNVIQVIDKKTCEPICQLSLNTNGFASSMTIIPGTSLILIADSKSGKYSILDMVNKSIIKTNSLDLPVHQIVIGKNIRKI